MKIVILDGAILNPGDVDWGPIEALGDVIVYDETSKEQLAERARGADVLLANKTCLRRDDLPALKDARMVGVLATGYNTVDVDAFAERRIPVCNVVAYGVDDVAQHAMALLLELCRHTSRHSHNTMDHTKDQTMGRTSPYSSRIAKDCASPTCGSANSMDHSHSSHRTKDRSSHPSGSFCGYCRNPPPR